MWIVKIHEGKPHLEWSLEFTSPTTGSPRQTQQKEKDFHYCTVPAGSKQASSSPATTQPMTHHHDSANEKPLDFQLLG